MAILTRSEARRRVKSWQEAGETVVFTNGCFDLLHAGHIELLSRARQLGDRLVVGLNSDGSVTRLKGAPRPLQTQEHRALILEALRMVDAVVIFSEDTPLQLIARLRPDVLVKGEDYAAEAIVGADLVQAYGGRVARVTLVQGVSTTAILKRIQPSRDPEKP